MPSLDWRADISRDLAALSLSELDSDLTMKIREKAIRRYGVNKNTAKKFVKNEVQRLKNRGDLEKNEVGMCPVRVSNVLRLQLDVLERTLLESPEENMMGDILASSVVGKDLVHLKLWFEAWMEALTFNKYIKICAENVLTVFNRKLPDNTFDGSDIKFEASDADRVKLRTKLQKIFGPLVLAARSNDWPEGVQYFKSVFPKLFPDRSSREKRQYLFEEDGNVSREEATYFGIFTESDVVFWQGVKLFSDAFALDPYLDLYSRVSYSPTCVNRRQDLLRMAADKLFQAAWESKCQWGVIFSIDWLVQHVLKNIAVDDGHNGISDDELDDLTIKMANALSGWSENNLDDASLARVMGSAPPFLLGVGLSRYIKAKAFRKCEYYMEQIMELYSSKTGDYNRWLPSLEGHLYFCFSVVKCASRQYEEAWRNWCKMESLREEKGQSVILGQLQEADILVTKSIILTRIGRVNDAIAILEDWDLEPSAKDIFKTWVQMSDYSSQGNMKLLAVVDPKFHQKYPSVDVFPSKYDIGKKGMYYEILASDAYRRRDFQEALHYSDLDFEYRFGRNLAYDASGFENMSEKSRGFMAMDTKFEHLYSSPFEHHGFPVFLRLSCYLELNDIDGGKRELNVIRHNHAQAVTHEMWELLYVENELTECSDNSTDRVLYRMKQVYENLSKKRRAAKKFEYGYANLKQSRDYYSAGNVRKAMALADVAAKYFADGELWRNALRRIISKKSNGEEIGMDAGSIAKYMMMQTMSEMSSQKEKATDIDEHKGERKSDFDEEISWENEWSTLDVISDHKFKTVFLPHLEKRHKKKIREARPRVDLGGGEVRREKFSWRIGDREYNEEDVLRVGESECYAIITRPPADLTTSFEESIQTGFIDENKQPKPKGVLIDRKKIVKVKINSDQRLYAKKIYYKRAISVVESPSGDSAEEASGFKYLIIFDHIGNHATIEREICDIKDEDGIDCLPADDADSNLRARKVKCHAQLYS